MDELLKELREKISPDICIQILKRLQSDPELLNVLSIEDKRMIVSGLVNAEDIYGPEKRVPKGKKLTSMIDSINL